MDFTYNEVGGTRGPLPAGFHHVERRVRIASGRAAFDAAAAALSRWDMHRGAGLRVQASTPTAEVDSAVTLKLGPVKIPCRVVYVVAEDNRSGFAYGTLPGHPEMGEELFVVEFDPSDDGVYAVIAAFSRPGRWYTRLGGPVARIVQQVLTDRYVAALRKSATPR